MGYSVECEIMGKPATIHVDTIEELRELMNYGNVVKTRQTATRRVAKHREPKGRGHNAPTRKNNKPAGKTKSKAKGSRGWGKDVYDRAKAKNISVMQARTELAAEKKKTGRKAAA